MKLILLGTNIYTKCACGLWSWDQLLSDWRKDTCGWKDGNRSSLVLFKQSPYPLPFGSRGPSTQAHTSMMVIYGHPVLHQCYTEHMPSNHHRMGLKHWDVRSMLCDPEKKVDEITWVICLIFSHPPNTAISSNALMMTRPNRKRQPIFLKKVRTTEERGHGCGNSTILDT